MAALENELQKVKLSTFVDSYNIFFLTPPETHVENFRNHLRTIGSDITFHIDKKYVIPNEDNYVDIDFDNAFTMSFYCHPCLTLVSSKPVAMLEYEDRRSISPISIGHNCVNLPLGIEFYNMRRSPRKDFRLDKSDYMFIPESLYEQEDFVLPKDAFTKLSFDNKGNVAKVYSKLTYKGVNDES